MNDAAILLASARAQRAAMLAYLESLDDIIRKYESAGAQVEVSGPTAPISVNISAEPVELVDAATLPPLTGGMMRTLIAVRAFIESGRRWTQFDLRNAAGSSASVMLYELGKLGYLRNKGARRAPDWKIAYKGEPRERDRERRLKVHAPAKRPTADRRFTEKKELEPERVTGLAPSHAALKEGRTIFPSSVVDPKDSQRLLISGANSLKLGSRVTKGPWTGFPIFQLSLEERATCPASCYHWSTCYGNSMPFARRHRHGDELVDYLRAELIDLQDEHPDGFVVRLHVLGDFYSVDYVGAWASFLRSFPALRVFGYTAHPRASEIGSAIARITKAQWDRFAIRFSAEDPAPEGTTTIWRLPEDDRVREGIVCPAQTGKTDCCGTCGLCWAAGAKNETIAFVAHGALGSRTGPRKAKTPEIVQTRSTPRFVKPPKVVKTASPSTSDAVKAWLEKNEPRRFEPGASGDPFNLKMYLKTKGVEVVGIRHNTAYNVAGKVMDIYGLIDVVNRYRKKDGLSPLTREDAA